jgi:myosin heavy subunit
MALDDIKKINEEINKLRAELGKNPLKPFDENDLERAKSLLSGLHAEVREMGNDLDYVYKSFKDSVNELSKQNRYLSDARKSINEISDISKKVLDYRKGETSLDEKTLQNLKKKATAQFDELQRIKEIGNLSKTNRGEVEKALADQEDFNNALDKTIAAQKQVNKDIGLLGTGIEGISKGLSKMGFGNLSQPLTEAIEKTKNARLQVELNNQAIEENENLLKKSNDILKDRFNYKKSIVEQAEKDVKSSESNIQKLNSQNKELDTQTSKYKNIGKALTSQLTKANLIDFAIQQMVDALIKADNQTGQLAKAFGTSYSEAASLRNELNTVANLSGDVNITTGALQESLIAVNKEFGTATMFSGELLKDFTNMTKVMGYTDEAAAKLSKITVATGTDLSDNTAEILGTAAAFNVTNKLALNEKEIVEGVAKASAATTVSLGMQPGKIAAAVVQAKALGLELEQVTGIAESLLNFESSISNELEAELLTGRALNLEQARYLALTNDVEGVAKEIANQGITAAEFGGMNMIQQKAIAEAVGLTKEELAQSLINQQALTKLGNKDKTLAEAYNRLKKEGLSDAQIQKQLGEDISAEQLKSQSIQERFNASVEKLQEIFVSIAEPILQIVSPFMDLVTTILPLINVVLQPTVNVLKSLGAIITTNILEPLKAVKEIFSGIIDIFKGDFKKGLIKIGSGLVRSIMVPFQAVLNGITTFINGLIDMINAIPGVDIKSLNSIDLTTTIIDSMKDGKIDYQKGVVVSGGFGSVQLDEKDTFIGDKNGIKAGTNLFGNTAQPTSPSISINMAPLVNEMQAVKAVLVQILNKDSNVYMDGAKVGKGINMARTKIG